MTGWPHGLDTLDFKDADSIGFSIAGGESVTRGYTRFSCHGNARCQVQILREGVLGDSFNITTEGIVTAELNTEIYEASLAYNAIKIVDPIYENNNYLEVNRIIPSEGFTRSREQRESNTVLVESKTLSFSGNIGTQNSYGWGGRKYEITDSGKVYNAYLYIDDPIGRSYTYYGYWTIKDSANNLVKVRPLTGWGHPNNIRGLPNDADLSAVTGTATYKGEAVGLYALKGSDEFTADSGSFTATATLEANFDTDRVKGTIDNFSGPTHDFLWSIELKETAISGVRFQHAETVWTIFGVEGDSGGAWDGEFFGNDSGKPRDIFGGFYAEHSEANGVISGGFGVKKQ